MDIQGTIIKVFPVNSGISQSGKEWASMKFLLQTPDLRYPKKILFDFFGKEKIAQTDLHEGDKVNVAFDIDAREYNGKWFNSVNAFAVLKMENFLQSEKVPAPKPTPQADHRVTTPSMFPDEPAGDTDDQLPF